MKTDQYQRQVVDPGDRASKFAHTINVESFHNCPAIEIVPHQPDNFRGPVGFRWKEHILRAMLKGYNAADQWNTLIEVENDGAGGKPQFFTLIGTRDALFDLGCEIITMNADDFARTGRLPCIIVNDMNTKGITKSSFHLFQAIMKGYGERLKQARLVSITGETAIMKHSITAFCDTGSDNQLVLTWGAACIGLCNQALLIDGSRITANMPIVGFWEPGYRCNGGTFFTDLILLLYGKDPRELVTNSNVRAFVEKLTIPSLSYAPTICDIVGWNHDGSVGRTMADVCGIANITGGGVWNKFSEILPEGVGADLDTMPDPAEVLATAQEMSWGTALQLSDYQAYGTFHGGCGMLLVAENDQEANAIIRKADYDGIVAQVVGCTTKSTNKQIRIQSRFKQRKELSSLHPE
ncbi:MAG: AIR synthase-related protein [Candidatus Berkelbacteria bacterium]|nr:AIR synthase-related protein [Candidatus Berkelbacteria bacterium]